MNKRIAYIDILRGVAVLLMVVAHSFAFFYSGDNKYLRFVQYLGDSSAFVLFLFTSGISSYFSYINKDQSSKIIQRSLVLFGVFYLVSFVSSIEDIIILANIKDQLWFVFDLIVLKRMGDYSEFILPFAIFSISIFWLKNFYQKLLSSKVALIIFCVIIYFVGYFIYILPIPELLAPYVALFAGHENMYRFPILQYISIFIAGMYYARTLGIKPLNLNLEIIRDFMGLILILLLSVYSTFLSSIPYSEPFNRWPPSIGFFSIGLIIALGLIVGSIQFKWNGSKIVESLSKNAINIYLIHIIFLEIYKLIWGNKFANSILVIFITIFFVFIVTQIPNFRFKLIQHTTK